MWTRLARSVLLPMRRFVLLRLAPISESREFRTLYPLLVVSLGVLAAFHTDRARTLVIFIAFTLIAFVSLVTIVLDAQKINLESRWNLLFFSYYRPSLIALTNKIARSMDGRQRIDILTYRTGDFISALDEAAVDFDHVSGGRFVNIASFDIEYVSLLKSGFERNGCHYKLIPLSDFWTGHGMNDLRNRVPTNIRTALLQRLDPDNLYALPIGWGLVGVGIFARDLSAQEVIELMTIESNQRPGFDFRQFFANLESIRSCGYEVLCYDFWGSIGQLVSLNYSGHMGISESEEETIRAAFKQIRTSLPQANIIADPLVLLDRVRSLDKSVVIGGSTWFGIKGTLLPIAIPDAQPSYGAFCVCLGILAAPDGDARELWERDAATLMLWLADQLGDQRDRPKIAAGRGSILRNYLPGLVRSTRVNGRATEARVDLASEQPMQIDEAAGVIFRQFSSAGIDSLFRVKDLWSKSDVS